MINERLSYPKENDRRFDAQKVCVLEYSRVQVELYVLCAEFVDHLADAALLLLP